MTRYNNLIPNNHFRKEWQLRVKTWFNQPMRKKRRRLARQAKAAKLSPRPAAGALRPLVACPTAKYNMKTRTGRGFTLDECKEAGINTKLARTIGICVDHRRRNRSVESFQDNVQRLKEYKSKLILFPRRLGKPKNGDSDVAELATATMLKGPLMPIVAVEDGPVEARAITDEDKAGRVYAKLRVERMNQRQAGIREKRAREKAAEEENK